MSRKVDTNPHAETLTMFLKHEWQGASSPLCQGLPAPSSIYIWAHWKKQLSRGTFNLWACIWLLATTTVLISISISLDTWNSRSLELEGCSGMWIFRAKVLSCFMSCLFEIHSWVPLYIFIFKCLPSRFLQLQRIYCCLWILEVFPSGI